MCVMRLGRCGSSECSGGVRDGAPRDEGIAVDDAPRMGSEMARRVASPLTHRAWCSIREMARHARASSLAHQECELPRDRARLEAAVAVQPDHALALDNLATTLLLLLRSPARPRRFEVTRDDVARKDVLS